MRKRRLCAAAWRVWRTGLGWALVLPALPGCAMLNGFFDPTALGSYNTLDQRESGIRRVLTPRETPPGVANATEPTPDDLVPHFQDYRMGPGDQVGVIVQNLSDQGGDLQTVVEISPTGMIRLPQIGTVRAQGLTEQELEQELRARVKEAQLLPDPIVQVILQSKRQQYFTIIGATGAPGPYAINDPDMRLLDVLGLARDIDANVKKIYVIRRENGYARPSTVPNEAAPDSSKSDGLIVPPDPMEEEENGVKPGGLSAHQGTGPQDPPDLAQPPQSEVEELERMIAESKKKKAGQAPASKPNVRRESDRRLSPYIYDPQTGQTIAVQPEKRAEDLNQPTGRTTQPAPKQPGFNWDNVPEYESANRVIEIDVAALKRGDPRFNIVIRNRDTINVPQDTGVFYMMGEINRPGVYAFGGREITIKQAVSVGGNLSPLAFPSRCEIVRREQGTDKQVIVPVNLDLIFAGREEDILLRDDDILNIGTNIISPFLYVIRNSFRFTYGFGFVYDRNFADRDAYNAKVNPQTIQQAQQAGRGLPF